MHLLNREPQHNHSTIVPEAYSELVEVSAKASVSHNWVSAILGDKDRRKRFLLESHQAGSELLVGQLGKLWTARCKSGVFLGYFSVHPFFGFFPCDDGLELLK